MKAAAKLLMLLFCMSIVFLASHSQASSPAKQEASKEKWEYYASDEEGADYLYNPKEVKHLKGDRVRVWVWARYPETNPNYHDARFEWEIDCTKKRMRGLKANAKKKDGTTVIIKESSDWSDIPAGSTAEALYGTVCKKKGAKTP